MGQTKSTGAPPLHFPPLIQLQPSHQTLLPSTQWQALSSTQIARYRTLWSGLSANDVPPYPKDGFEELLDEIRKRAREVNAREILMLAAELDAEGTVIDVKPVRYSDDQLLKRATWAIVETKFRPALCNGVVCASKIPIVVKVPG